MGNLQYPLCKSLVVLRHCGECNYNISWYSHEGRVKHVVIESKPDRVCGVLYHITPQGPFTDTIEELIEKAKQSCIIQNHLFEVTLTTCPPKVRCIYLYSLQFT